MIHGMKDTPNDRIEPFDDPAHEREWLAQESAMRRERLQLDPRNDDARTQRYRMLARSLRQPPEDGLPADFAQQMARQLGPVRARRFDAPFESSLIIVLCLVMLTGSMVFLAPYSAQWWHSLVTLSRSGTSSMSMLLAFAACIALTGLVGRWSSSARKH